MTERQIALPPVQLKGSVMPITALLRDQPFPPETIDEMSAALTGVCRKLGLTTNSDQATLVVAGKIIELAQRGVRTRTGLTLLALKEFQEGK